MQNLEALRKAALDAAQTFVVARDRLVDAENTFNAALKLSGRRPPDILPLSFSNQLATASDRNLTDC